METQNALNILISSIMDHATFICVLIFIFLMAWQGFKKGFMISLLSLGSVFVTLVVDFFMLSFFMSWIEDIPALSDGLDTLSRQILGGISSLRGEDASLGEYLLSESTTDLIKEIIIFVAVFILTQLILRILLAFARNIKKITLIDWLDKATGAVLGVVEAILAVWIFMVVISLFSGHALILEIYRQIFADEFLRFLYLINPVNSLLGLMAGVGTATASIC